MSDSKKTRNGIIIAALVFIGYKMMSSKKDPATTGFPLIDNNNPLAILSSNINWKGEAGHNFNPTWEAFDSMLYGWRAALINGRTIADSVSSMPLSDFIYIWAKGGKGDRPNNYVSYVTQKSGANAYTDMQTLFRNRDMNNIWKIYKAMAEFESSPQASNYIQDSYSDYTKGWSLI